ISCRFMRSFACLAALALLSTSGCATTVYRLDGEFETPAGRAAGPCEVRDWLVVAPTRAEIVPEGSKRSITEDDGVGLYRVGEDAPQSITGFSDQLSPYGGRDVMARKVEAVQAYDRKRIISGSLGIAGIATLAIGGVLFTQSFQTVESGGEEEQRIDSARLTTGAVVALLGLGMGIAGVVVNPSHEERTRANATRYVFTPEDMPREEVQAMVGGYNEDVRG